MPPPDSAPPSYSDLDNHNIDKVPSLAASNMLVQRYTAVL